MTSPDPTRCNLCGHVLPSLYSARLHAAEVHGIPQTPAGGREDGVTAPAGLPAGAIPPAPANGGAE